MNPTNSKNTMRLQVFLAHQGVCSRRNAMGLIQQGHVAVNGRVVREPSTPVDPRQDKVFVDGKRVEEKQYDYLLLNKPAGYVTTMADHFDEKTVLDLLPSELRHLRPVGRLDKDTEGLLLLTNDGDLTLKLTHPRYDVDKTYLVHIPGELTLEEKQQLENGVVIERQKTAPAKITQVKRNARHTEFLLTIHEGRKRQIRLMLAKLRHQVVYLKRIQQGPLTLGTLKTGCSRRLTGEEIKNLKKFCQ